MEFNVTGAYVGEFTPAFIKKAPTEKIERWLLKLN
jgi:hypothetical protein